MYEMLLTQVKTARKYSALFYRVDLHIHTHESDDFPCLGNKPGCATELTSKDKSACAEFFIQSAVNSGLDLIAITDHNRNRLATEIASLANDKLVVLPGMEVSLKTSFLPNSTIHILALFPERYEHGDIERVFSNTGMPLYSERNDATVLDMPVQDFVKAVHDGGGICVASHVNSSKGIRDLFRSSNISLIKNELRRKELLLRKSRSILSEQETQELIRMGTNCEELEDDIQNRYLQFLVTYGLDAVEVQHGTERQFYTGTHVDDLGIRPIPCLVGSDAHNLSDIGLSGCTTYIKMTNPGYTDLRKALRDPGTRIRFDHDVPRPRIARILGVQFEGGFFGANTIGFSDNLTCLIGGRGSGKSATIEALRYTLEQPLECLPITKRKDINDRLQHTLVDTDIKVVLQDRTGDVYVIKRRYGENRALCLSCDGTPHSDMDVSVATNLRVKIFGWGEIEELARNKRDQLYLIDGFVPEVAQAKQLVTSLMPALRSNTQTILAFAKEIQELLPSVAELSTKKEILAKLNTPELDAVFVNFDANQAAFAAIESIRTVVQSIHEALVKQDNTSHTFKQRLETTFSGAENRLRAYEWFSDFQDAYVSRTDSIEQTYLNLLVEIKGLSVNVDQIKTNLATEFAEIEQNLNTATEEIDASDAKSSRSRRKTLTEEVSNLQSIQDQIDQKQEQIVDLLKDRWNRLVPALETAKQAVTDLRNNKLSELNDQLLKLSSTVKVSISLQHQKDRQAFAKALGTDNPSDPDGLLKNVYRYYKRDKYAENYARVHTPHSFVQAILNDADIECSELCIFVMTEDAKRIDIINKERACSVKSHLHPKDESGYYDTEKLKSILELEHLDIEDLPQISLDGAAIEELSPGQRCSALIPVILLEGDCPLIIDQPEDNLDNRLVFGLVVDIIRALKEQRQIIVATHNPNVPVSGDAEQIVVFNALTRDTCESVVQGSIDREDIVSNVKAIMEGSEEAFRIRADKYGYTHR